MTQQTRHEAYMMQLVNQSRADAGMRPLRFDGDLNQSADWHSAWMLSTDVFSHSGQGGTRVTDRVENAGYQLSGAWAVGENLAMRQVGGRPGLWDDVRALHAILMDSPGHRANILSGQYDEAGFGIQVGWFQGVQVVMATQNFARTSADDRAFGNSADDFVFTGAVKRPAGEADVFRIAPEPVATSRVSETPESEPPESEPPESASPVSASPESRPTPLWLDSPWSDLL